MGIDVWDSGGFGWRDGVVMILDMVDCIGFIVFLGFDSGGC